MRAPKYLVSRWGWLGVGVGGYRRIIVKFRLKGPADILKTTAGRVHPYPETKESPNTLQPLVSFSPNVGEDNFIFLLIFSFSNQYSHGSLPHSVTLVFVHTVESGISARHPCETHIGALIPRGCRVRPRGVYLPGIPLLLFSCYTFLEGSVALPFRR